MRSKPSVVQKRTTRAISYVANVTALMLSIIGVMGIVNLSRGDRRFSNYIALWDARPA